MNIVIIDYNSGNLASLKNSLENASNKKALKVKISNSPDHILAADRLILPGVGDFYNCKQQLFKINGMLDAVYEYIKKKQRPFLGICIGMQLMSNTSYERGKNAGLGLIDSKVIMIDEKNIDIRVPHMGWNDIQIQNKNYLKKFSSLNKKNFYFVHSYHMECKNKIEVLATVNYGKKMVAAVCKDNIIGVQFHPEKSQLVGIKFLQQFIDWKP